MIKKIPVVIVGAGAAGIGMGIVLKKMGLDFLILEKGQIGQSFQDWPPGTRFLSPSFTGNFFGSPDLNAVCPDTSPAYIMHTEHPSGKEYARYLKGVATFYKLPVLEGTKVTTLNKTDDRFHITTEQADIVAEVVIWAGGEYQFPKRKVCEGYELAIHNTKIADYDSLEGERFPIIGGYESAFDTAFQLALRGKKSVLFDSENHLAEPRSDASFSLSPYTKDRLRQFMGYINIKPYTRIQRIEKKAHQYFLTSATEERFISETQPILATGFETSLVQVKDFFAWKEKSPELTAFDESTKVDGFFLVGPQVRHGNVIFCFIYKFRQRFAVVAEAIAQKLGVSESEHIQNVVKTYQQRNFYLNDLSCCEDECVC